MNPAGHARPQRLLRGHLPHSGGGRHRIMLIDCVKGVEPQTIKLFQVCRMRGIPIVTFVNKLDGRQGSIRTSRRDRARARHSVQPGQLADRLRSLVRGASRVAGPGRCRSSKGQAAAAGARCAWRAGTTPSCCRLSGKARWMFARRCGPAIRPARPLTVRVSSPVRSRRSFSAAP